MLTQTTEIAIKALVYLAVRGGERMVTPNEIAHSLNCSASYLAKVMGHPVKSGLLRSHRGPQGGMSLHRPPAEISLLDIVEATQGLLVANYCDVMVAPTDRPVCGLHRAMWDVRNSTIEALRRWTLADVACPARHELAGSCDCHLGFLYAVAANGHHHEGNDNGTPI